jgi:hypothetical protein
LKAVIITLFYSTIQGKNILETSLYSESKLYFFLFFKGFVLFCGVGDYGKYLNERYFSLLDYLLVNKILLKILVFIDIWFRSFLFRATFILDMIFMIVLENEIWKRQKLLTDLIVLYTEKLYEHRINLSKILINKFRLTHRRLHEIIISADEISGPASLVVVLFFIFYSLTDINSFVVIENKG